MEHRQLGSSGLSVSTLGFGGASLGDLYVNISNAQALDAVAEAYDCGIRYFDTAPWYGTGLSEQRMGLALHDYPRGDFHLSTKVGRSLRPVSESDWPKTWPWGGCPYAVEFDYTADGIRQQHHESLHRLGVGRVDCLVIHDMEESASLGGKSIAEHKADLRDGGFKALYDLREEGRVQALGVGVNVAQEVVELVPEASDLAAARRWNKEYVEFIAGLAGEGQRSVDFVLLAGVYTLLDTSAWEDGILDLCKEKNIGVVMGGPYSSGILASGAVEGAMYAYSPATAEILDKVRRMESVCAEHSVPLAAAALRFPLGHEAVSTVIPGGKNAFEVNRNAETFANQVPVKLWEDFKDQGLLPEGVPTPTE